MIESMMIERMTEPVRAKAPVLLSRVAVPQEGLIAPGDGLAGAPGYEMANT